MTHRYCVFLQGSWSLSCSKKSKREILKCINAKHILCFCLWFCWKSVKSQIIVLDIKFIHKIDLLYFLNLALFCNQHHFNCMLSQAKICMLWYIVMEITTKKKHTKLLSGAIVYFYNSISLLFCFFILRNWKLDIKSTLSGLPIFRNGENLHKCNMS